MFRNLLVRNQGAHQLLLCNTVTKQYFDVLRMYKSWRVSPLQNKYVYRAEVLHRKLEQRV